MLLELYNSKIVNDLQKDFNYSNVMQIPRLVKVSINTAFGNADKAFISSVADDLMMITAQRPCFTHARKSVSNFKLREGVTIGCKVTLRRLKMYHFLERLLNLALPRSRDFRGFSVKSFDGNGNFSFGVKEHIIFPEINYNNVTKIYGMDITVVTTASTKEEAIALLRYLGFPFLQ